MGPPPVNVDPLTPASAPRLSRTVHDWLLPGHGLRTGEYTLAGFSEAASHAGGDHYDWLELDDGRLLVTLADVSGHGLESAIVTAACRAYARAVLTGAEPLPEQMRRLNEWVCRDLPDGRFVTFVACVLDPRAHTAEILSAGHGPYFVVRGRTNHVRAHGAHGLPLGVEAETPYLETLRVQLDPTDALVLISDGFVEVASRDREWLGVDRFADALSHVASASPLGMIEAARASASAFADGQPPRDDMTMVVVKRDADPPPSARAPMS